MEEKYFAVFDLKSQTYDSLNYFHYHQSSNRTSRITNQKRVLAHLVKKLSLLIFSKNQKIVRAYKSILEFFLVTFNKTKEKAILTSMSYLIELLYLINKSQKKSWIKLRALYLTFIKENHFSIQNHENTLLRKAYFSTSEQFLKSIDNQELNTKKLIQLQYFYKPAKYTNYQNCNIGVYTYLYLAQKQIISIDLIQFQNQQWLANKLYLEMVLLRKSQIDYDMILSFGLQDPFDHNLRQYEYLLDNQKGKKVYSEILLQKLKYLNQDQIWESAYDFQFEQINPQRLEQIFMTYENYFLDIFIETHVHENCDLLNIQNHLKTRNEQLKKLCKKQSTKLRAYINQINDILVS